jgi:hypothetical protein
MLRLLMVTDAMSKNRAAAITDCLAKVRLIERLGP